MARTSDANRPIGRTNAMTNPPAEKPIVIGFAKHAGVPCVPEPSDDPIADWLVLMEVVEALCPEWPEREVSIGRGL